MCGIAGIFHLDGSALNPQDLKTFTDSMLHRGPDGSGYTMLHNNSLGLGHRRLSILDLTDAGNQPMSYAGGRYTIAYNGEVFNFPEIRNELQNKGHRFVSDTDTEVILAAYTEWGKACLNRFNGMWAFAIWDENEQHLFLARDRFGIKPLYYLFEPGKRFVFASETRAFKFLPGFQRNINESRLAINIVDSYALEGLGHTIFESVYQLLPGHTITIRADKNVRQKRWWNIHDHVVSSTESHEKQTERFYELFRDSCRLRLISDVPLATALSGGLDSTSVYSTVFDIIRNEHPERISKDAQKAFTAVFPGLDTDEKEYAAKAAGFIGGDIHYISQDENTLPDQIIRDTEKCDFISVSPISAIAGVYRGMRENGMVVSLDGHGVDEMMYGYRDMVYELFNHAIRFGNAKQAQTYASVLSAMYHPSAKDEVTARLAGQTTIRLKHDRHPLRRLKKMLTATPAYSYPVHQSLEQLSDQPYDFSSLPVEQGMLYYEFFLHTLPALLRNFDRAGMINSIEIRMPFMDWRLVSYVFSLPVSRKIGNGYTKLILREAMKGKIEESLRLRTFKVGIGSPVDAWFNNSLRSWSMDMVSDMQLKQEAEKMIKNQGRLDTPMVRKMWQDINLKLITS